MAAKKTGGTVGRIKAKNQAMAAAMKAEWVERGTCRCPICHRIVSVRVVYTHIISCKE